MIIDNMIATDADSHTPPEAEFYVQLLSFDSDEEEMERLKDCDKFPYKDYNIQHDVLSSSMVVDMILDRNVYT